MFSSLLPKPQKSQYDSSNYFSLHRPKKTSTQLTKLPPKISTSVIANPESEHTISKYVLNDDGTLNYGLTIASSSGKTLNVQATYEDTIPLKKRFPKLKHHFPRYTLENCPDNSLAETLQETKNVIAKLTGPHVESNKNDVTYVKYHPESIIKDKEDRGRTIEIREFQQDPTLPPKFKLRKNRHKEPSPPPPILKDNNASQTKLTKEDREKWNIPAAISNWKNNQGFTISLDKRILAANGGSKVEGPDINLEKFGGLSGALEKADLEAREEIKIRNEEQRRIAAEEQNEKERRLRLLAEETKNDRNKNGKRQRGNYDQYSKRPKHKQ